VSIIGVPPVLVDAAVEPLTLAVVTPVVVTPVVLTDVLATDVLATDVLATDVLALVVAAVVDPEEEAVLMPDEDEFDAGMPELEVGEPLLELFVALVVLGAPPWPPDPSVSESSPQPAARPNSANPKASFRMIPPMSQPKLRVAGGYSGWLKT
jgi:hypothetical protein